MKIITAILLGVLIALFGSWMLMLAVGILGFGLDYASAIGLNLVISIWIATLRLGNR